MASGAAAASFFNTYLLANLEALKSDAGAWLRQADPLETVENPTVYRGSTLRYTGAVEEVSRFIGVVAAQAEALARSHGETLDRKRLIKQQLARRGGDVRRLF